MKVLVTGADGFVGRYLLAALAEAGHLIIGYGMPWLSGDLLPPNA